MGLIVDQILMMIAMEGVEGIVHIHLKKEDPIHKRINNEWNVREWNRRGIRKREEEEDWKKLRRRKIFQLNSLKQLIRNKF